MIIETKEVAAIPDAIILQLTGDLGFECITQLSDSFIQIEKSDKKYAIVDMTKVNLISSAALGEFMGGRKRLIEKGGDLVFAGLKMDIRTKLGLMGATKIFRIFSDIRSALNSYKWENGSHPENIKVKFPSNLSIVPPVRQLISRIAKQKGYGNRDSFRIETIVDEICNNAVEHGKQGNDQCINVHLQIDPEKIELDIINTSDPDKIESLKTLLQPHEIGDAKPDEKRGRGLALIKMLSDELSVNCTEIGTSVHVKKKREE